MTIWVLVLVYLYAPTSSIVDVYDNENSCLLKAADIRANRVDVKAECHMAFVRGNK